MSKVKRCAVLVLYDKGGIFDEYVYFLIDELKTISEKLFVVVNGKIDIVHRNRINSLCDVLSVRENKGFDGEAYRHVFTTYFSNNELHEFDELILCNDTFFGPFVPFVDIFKQMEKKEYDFWGLNYVDIGITQYITSYFLVFKSRVIRSNILNAFFKSMHPITSYAEATIYFEHVLFETLNEQYNFAYYCRETNVDLFRNPYSSIAEYKMPIMKRKSFAKNYINKTAVLLSLGYIKKYMRYDISIILSQISREFGLNITLEQITSVSCVKMIPENKKLEAICNFDILRRFIDAHKIVFFFGAGVYSLHLLKSVANIKPIQAILVSAGHKNIENFAEIPIIEYPEFIKTYSKENYCIIVTLKTPGRLGIKQMLGEGENILYLWAD